ncbi:Chitin binding domain [Trinorchestia longiramus]|nr:Chitin binding domain [Trinorchestia longiramus]
MASTHRLLAALLILAVASAAAQPNLAGFECPEEGRFSNPIDCTSFYTCLLGEDGEFISSKGSCKGYAFDPERQTCVSPDKVPGCHARDSRQIATDPRYDDLCEMDNFVCSDCKTVINCVDGKGFVDSSCPNDFTCQSPDAFNGTSTCYPTAAAETECKCTEAGTFKVDPWNENAFVFCPMVDSDPMVHHCPGEMTFDSDLLECVNSDGIPACTESGVFANPMNCTQYYTCIPTSSGMVQKTLTCEDSSLMYNEVTKECSDPCSWPKSTFECSAEGRFPDPANCENFFLCIADPKNEGQFIQSPRKCPPNYIWDPKAPNGGHCASVNDEKTTKCTPVTDNKCNIADICGESTSSSSITSIRSRLGFRRQTPFPAAFAEMREDPIKNVIQLLKDTHSDS